MNYFNNLADTKCQHEATKSKWSRSQLSPSFTIRFYTKPIKNLVASSPERLGPRIMSLVMHWRKKDKKKTCFSRIKNHTKLKREEVNVPGHARCDAQTVWLQILSSHSRLSSTKSVAWITPQTWATSLPWSRPKTSRLSKLKNRSMHARLQIWKSYYPWLHGFKLLIFFIEINIKMFVVP